MPQIVLRNQMEFLDLARDGVAADAEPLRASTLRPRVKSSASRITAASKRRAVRPSHRPSSRATAVRPRCAGHAPATDNRPAHRRSAPPRRARTPPLPHRLPVARAPSRHRCRAHPHHRPLQRPARRPARGRAADPDLDRLRGRHHGQPVREVLELAHVAGKRQRREVSQRFVGHALRLDAEIARALLQEVAREQRDVLAAFAQRRQAQPDHVEPVVKVLAEQPCRTRDSRFWCVAAITRTFARSGLWPPTR